MSPAKLCMIAVLGVAVTVILKQWKSDVLPLIRIGFVILFSTAFLSAVRPLVTFLTGLGAGNETGEYITLLLKALGIAILSDVCANLCRESGEGAIAGGVELVGKVEILLLCVPLMEQVLALARALLDTGGGS